MKKITIAVLGLGEIGSQVVIYLKREKQRIEKENPVEIVIRGIFVRDRKKKRNVDVTGFFITDDPMEVLKDADIVFECMGGNGVEDTRKLVLYAIEHKKTVIMSSKKCLAMYGQQIVKATEGKKSLLYYDATVGGGIPISTILGSMGKCEQIKRIYGICNATSNFILSNMSENQLSYIDALQKAQELGYAENDPGDDVDGYDALYKSVIMAGFGMKHWIDCKKIIPRSIKEIEEKDIEEAKSKCQTIKPVFLLEKRGEKIHFEIGPKRVESDSIMSAIKGCNNIFVIEGSESGERMFIGKGAGAKPTASAMFDDFIKILVDRRVLSD